MKKFITVCAALLVGASALFAQNPYDYSERWNVSLTGGGLFSGSENYFSYKENGRFYDLINWQGSFAVGYDFSKYFGARLWAGYGKNAGAGNVRQTGDGSGFFPYTFKSISTFADAILNVMGLAEEDGPFTTKFYAGLGLGYSWDMTRSKRNTFDGEGIHPMYPPKEKNLAFGFRLGAMLEYDIRPNFGFLIDMNAEAYVDNFNGIRPSEDDHSSREGYAGFPLDLRAYASFGVVYHF